MQLQSIPDGRVFDAARLTISGRLFLRPNAGIVPTAILDVKIQNLLGEELIVGGIFSVVPNPQSELSGITLDECSDDEERRRRIKPLGEERISPDLRLPPFGVFEDQLVFALKPIPSGVVDVNSFLVPVPIRPAVLQGLNMIVRTFPAGFSP